MSKFAVGVCNLLENVNEVKVVEANNEIEAIVLAVGDDISIAERFETKEEIIQNYWDGELIVSDPVKL